MSQETVKRTADRERRRGDINLDGLIGHDAENNSQASEGIRKSVCEAYQR